MKFLKAGICAILLIAVVTALHTKFGSIPPLGKFFDPQAGFWANAVTADNQDDELQLAGLKDKVSIYYDERQVPHIFAQNDHDLYYAQGYVTAKDRLFQMEMQVFDAAGRLAEKVGEQALERDRSTRKLGMTYGADQAYEVLKKDEVSWAAVQAYSKGVNAYLAELSVEDYPIEYKVLDFAPEVWTEKNTVYLLKNMTRTLAGGNNDIRTSNTLQYFGEDFIETFFTTKPALNDPIIPASKKWDFERVPVNQPDSLYVPSDIRGVDDFERPEGVGSNNWAVAGSKTKSGYPILSNDPHLSLTYPSIWYEVQLHSPTVNVRGVSLQGAPGVVIGFNEKVAWGVTNVGSDVMDWYEITFKDKTMSEYWYDGAWQPTSQRIEEIKVRGEETILDTLIYTHHGPVWELNSATDEEKTKYFALRWIAHEGSSDIRTFYGLNRAEDYDDYVEALSHYVAPAQNFVFASSEGDIALWVNGKFPNKWKHQGRTVSDGSDPRYDWQGWIPFEHNPHVKNPERGFVSSANQESAAEDYPYYLDDEFAPFERGRRINDRLREMEDITMQDMMELQMDNFSYHASTILPELINWVDSSELSEDEQEFLQQLSEWNFFNNADLIEPFLFRQWWRQFYNAIFNDEYGSVELAMRRPSRDRVIELIKENPEMAFIDDITTDKKESIQELATASFKKAIANIYSSLGEEVTDRWKWGYQMNNDIEHISYIPGFGDQNVISGGSSESVNATRDGFGPSWRMVIELGPEVRGYGVYPGGPSGNPGSPYYDNMLEAWRTGKHFELILHKEAPTEYSYSVELSPKK